MENLKESSVGMECYNPLLQPTSTVMGGGCMLLVGFHGLIPCRSR